MKYRGTDIDGVSIEPDRLEVRGKPIERMMGDFGFAEAAWFVITGTRPSADAAGALDAALAGGLAGIGPGHVAWRLAALAAGSGAGMARAVTAGLMGLKAPAGDAPALAALPGLPEGAAEGLSVTAAVPALVAAWRLNRPCGGGDVAHAPARAEAGFLPGLVAAAAVVAGSGPAGQRLLEDALVGWVGGFGYLPPSIMIPRIAIGTGVPVRHALAAGFGAAGPMHIGATEQATGMIAAAVAMAGGAPAERMAGIIAAVRAKGQRIGGFGHPLLRADPRPPRMRARVSELGLDDHPAVAIYDAACDHMMAEGGLAPNVDFATGMACVIAGLSDPAVAAGIAMAGRTVGMTAHVIERRSRPAFGVNSATARQYLETIPEGWL